MKSKNTVRDRVERKDSRTDPSCKATWNKGEQGPAKNFVGGGGGWKVLG